MVTGELPCVTNTEQRIAARRFIPDFLIQLNATFNTNYTCLLLRVIIGVTNYGSSFTAVYLYIKAELARA